MGNLGLPRRIFSADNRIAAEPSGNEVLRLYQPLCGLETQLCKTLRDTHTHMRDEGARQQVKVYGSIAEESVLGRMFAQPDMTEVETDVMWNMGEITSLADYENIVSPVEGKPGFFSINGRTYLQHCLDTSDDRINGLMSVFYQSQTVQRRVIQNGYVNAASIRICQRLWVGQNTVGSTQFAPVAAIGACLLSDSPLQAPCARARITNKVNGPCSTSHYDFIMRSGCSSKKHYRFTYDNLVCIVIPWPRNIAEEWSRRTRKWPPDGDIGKVTQSPCHLVPKSDDDPSQWRISFSAAESLYTALYRKHTGKRYLVYLAFKATFYRHVYPVTYMCPGSQEEKHFGSFLAKTIMMWLCDKTDTEDWPEDHMFERFSDLCNDLRRCLDTGSLPNFFVPSVNLLENIPEEACRKAAERVPSTPPENPERDIEQALFFNRRIANLPRLIEGKIRLAYDELSTVIEGLDEEWDQDSRSIILYDTDDCCCSMCTNVCCFSRFI